MLGSGSPPRLSEYLTVGEAAAVLGVSPWTLRNWDRAGKLRPIRHPKNGYRIYRHEDLTAVLSGGKAEASSAATMPLVDWRGMGEREHFVQFYESDSFLVESVGGYVGAGLEAGDGAIVIATRPHGAAIDKKLKAGGLDLAMARASGQYLSLDAAETLSKFMVDGLPDPKLFSETIGSVVARVSAGRSRLRAFGEMVALLWGEGNNAGAIRLEELWNELGKSQRFALFCAYPIGGFDVRADGVPLEQVCKCHTRVIPAESYAAVSSADRRHREVVLLQQRAKSLEAEIAHRKEVEKSLAQRERELSDFVENALEGLHQVGPDGVIIWANKAELDMLGYAAGEYIGHHVGEFHADRGAIEDMLGRLLRGKSLYNHPATLRCKDGSLKHVLVHSNAYFEDGQFVYTRCFTRDVTERLRAEAELREARGVAERANKAKDHFLAVLSHELRTPLTPVLMAVTAMEVEAGLPPGLREELAMIRRNIVLETRLIDDLLDLSRVVNGKMSLQKEEVAVHRLIQGVVEMVSADAAQKRLEVRLELAAENDRVYADPARLHQVVWNLLKNAVKFTPEGRAVTIGTRGGAAGRVAIEVRDSGVGIDPRVLPGIFDAFDQGEQGVNRTFGGLGLGLAISKAIIELHEGTIRGESEGKGRGACFTIELPTAGRVRAGEIVRHTPDGGGGRAEPLRILLVEDHEDTLRVLRRLLEKYGHAVTTAGSVAEAGLAAESERFDVLISDIGLPDGNGEDVIGRVHVRQPGLPAIALTGFGMEQDVRRSGRAGFGAHLTKPVDVAALKAAIQRLVAEAGNP